MAHIVLEGYRPKEGDFVSTGPSVVEGIVNGTAGARPLRQGVGAGPQPQSLRALPDLQGDRRVDGVEDTGELRPGDDGSAARGRLLRYVLGGKDPHGPHSLGVHLRPPSGCAEQPVDQCHLDGERVDPSAASPFLTSLCECLRSLRAPGDDPPELIVLGDLFELALTAPEDAAATFSQFISALRPGTGDAAVAPHIRFVPGNHDHHLWTRGSDDRYLRMLEDDLTSTPKPRDRHSTHLLPSNEGFPVRDRFVEILAKRGSNGISVTVEQSYPNLGLVDGSGQRAVVLSHGHFIEPLYRVMSFLDRVFGIAPLRRHRSLAARSGQRRLDRLLLVLNGRQRRHHAGHPIAL